MNKYLIPALVFALAAACSAPAASALQGPVAAGSATTTDENARGLKEALATGTQRTIELLGREDGYWANDAVRIPLPATLDRVGKLASHLGQEEKVDAFQRSMNRAAEQAVGEVGDILADAIRDMSWRDAGAILRGGDHAATDYFREHSGEVLRARILPLVSAATAEVGVTEKYKALIARHGKSAGKALALLGGHADDEDGALDLDAYVTERTLDGLFTVLAEQEAAIRHDPLARGTSLLRRVFGSRASGQ